MTGGPKRDVVYVDHYGCAAMGRWPTLVALAERAAAERARCADLLARAAPPGACGPEIPAAPARGPMLTFQPREVSLTEAGNWRTVPAGHAGRMGARVASPFELMTCAARKAHAREVARAEREGRAPPEWRPLFTLGQMAVAEDYAALAERCASAGMTCGTLEPGRGGAGAGCREEAILSDLRRLAVYHRRIGDGLAREVRRFRPGGAARRPIRVRALVDMVCLGGASLDAVLRAHGWAPDGRIRAALRRSLCAALDRMQGYDLTRPQDMA